MPRIKSKVNAFTPISVKPSLSSPEHGRPDQRPDHRARAAIASAVPPITARRHGKEHDRACRPPSDRST